MRLEPQLLNLLGYYFLTVFQRLLNFSPFFIMEVWKDVLDFEGLYQVSNLGRVKSLWFGKEKILKQNFDGEGYLRLLLCKNRIKYPKSVHRLVYEAFNGKTNLQVDHICEGDKTDNRLCNLQAVSCRNNISKHRLSTKKTSQYVGVSWNKQSNKWTAMISVNKANKYLGRYDNEIDAHNAYQTELLKIIN